MNYPKVSIHIISYNQYQYIAETIESAITQDYPNLEIVISDDGSFDGTAEIISSYKRRYPDLIVALLNKDNVGITANSNRALRACTGKYVAFQGGDDVLLPGKISAQVRWLEESDKRVLCGHQVEVFYQDNSKSPHPISRTLESGIGPKVFIRNGNQFAATSVMIRADQIPAHGFEENLPIVSDHMLWVECLLSNGEFGFIPGIYSRYRRHSGNVTSSEIKNIEEHEKTLKLIMTKYPQYQCECKYALAEQVMYARGCYYLQAGSASDARFFLWESIKINPFNFKSWFRLAQASLKI